MANTFEVGKVNAGTGSTTDLTISGFGTPDLVEIWVCYATSDATDVAHEGISYGWTDLSNEWVVSWQNQDSLSNPAPTSAHRAAHSSRCVQLLTASGSAVADYATFSTTITDGIRIQWNGGSAVGRSYRIIYAFYKGGNHEVGTALSNATINTAQTVSLSDSGLSPEVLRCAAIGNETTWDGTITADATFSHGFATDESGGIVNGAVGHDRESGSSKQDAAGYISSTTTPRCIKHAEAQSTSYAGLECTDLGTAGQFDVTTRDVGAQMRFGYVVSDWGGTCLFELLQWDADFSSGSSTSYNGASFAFELQVQALTNMHTGRDSNTKGALNPPGAIGLTDDGITSHLLAWYCDDNASTTAAFCRYDNEWVRVTNETGGLSYRDAALDSVDSDGWTYTPATTAANSKHTWALILADDSAVTGTAAVTTGAVEASAAGAETFEGSATVTAGAASTSATGAETFEGSAAVTTGPATAAATGAETFTGTSDVTAGAPAASATGLETFEGTSTAAAAAATASATGTVANPITGTADVTAGAMQASAAGAETFVGSAAVAVGTPQATAVGLETMSGTAAVTTAGASAAAAGVEEMLGTADVAVPAAQTSASGTVTSTAVTGTADVVVPAAQAAAVGAEAFIGTAAMTLGAAQASATGTSVTGVSGTAAVTLAAVEAGAEGLETFAGAAAPTTGAPQVTATGTVANPVTGTADVAAPALQIAGVGAEAFVGSADVALAPAELVAVGAETFLGTAAVALAPARTSTAGLETFVGSAAIVVPAVQESSSGQVVLDVTGSSAVVVPAVQASASGIVPVSGAASPTYTAVANLIRARWAAQLEDGGLLTVYDNGDPQAAAVAGASIWARARVEFQSAVHGALGGGDLYLRRGRVVASLHVPIGVGDAAALAAADDVAAAFRFFETSTLRFGAPSHRPGRREGRWWVVDVEAPFEYEATIQ